MDGHTPLTHSHTCHCDVLDGPNHNVPAKNNLSFFPSSAVNVFLEYELGIQIHNIFMNLYSALCVVGNHFIFAWNENKNDDWKQEEEEGEEAKTS